MRDNVKAEVVQISESVARNIFAHTNLYWTVEREVHARLPNMVSQHADAMLPNLARHAVARAAPDLAAAQQAVEHAVCERVAEGLPALMRQVAGDAVAELAAEAVRAATPDTGAVRAQLAGAVAADLNALVSAELLPELIRRTTERVGAVATEAVRRESHRLLPDLAGAAVTAATPDRAALTAEIAAAVRADAVREVSAWLTEAVRGAAAAAAADLTGQVAEQALTEVRGVVRQETERAFAQYAPHVVSVTLPRGSTVELGADAHEVLPEVLVALHARCNVLLVGPAGTGKSMLAKHAAAALELPFQALSLGPTTPMSKVFGYYDANGHYHDTPFRRAFEDGGVMLLDELDNGHPGLLAELNQALALGTCAFADGMVDAHPDFRLVATGNTYGTGGDRQYVGRQSLDSATLDRFVVIDVPIDEKLEERIAVRHAPSHPEAVADLVARVRTLRALAEEKKLPVIFSPRASIDGARLLEAGATVEQVLQWRVVRGLSNAHRAALELDRDRC